MTAKKDDIALDFRTSAALTLGIELELQIVDRRTGDLTRGASAQALQAFNVSQGWPDALGLPEIAQFP